MGKAERTYLHDAVAWESNYEYTRKTATFENNTGGVANFDPGLILEDSTGNLVPLATAASAEAVLATPINNLADGATIKVAVIVRGPALLNEGGLDANGQDLATALTALAALSPPILSKKGPTKTTTLGA